MHKEIYQKLYEQGDYGNASKDKCPGVRYFRHYRKWLLSPIMDLGCGTGDTVGLMRQQGYHAEGIDQIDIGNGMVIGDITDPRTVLDGYSTMTCLDVLEHLDLEGISNVLSMMADAGRQVITVHSGPSNWHGVDLHVTQRPVEWWEEKIGEYLKIVRRADLDFMRYLFLCESKK